MADDEARSAPSSASAQATTRLSPGALAPTATRWPMPDHVHMLLSIPPKYAVSQVVGFIKGKSAIHMARVYGERKRNFVGQHFWARGFFVNTIGRDEEAIRAYIRNQEKSRRRVRNPADPCTCDLSQTTTSSSARPRAVGARKE